MPQPILSQQADNRWRNRQIIRYGQKPLPVVGTIKPWVDLNDGVSLYAQTLDITDAKVLQSERQPWRAESLWMPEDFDPAVAKITLRIDETGGMTLQQARALLLVAGEQWLTFDNATGLVAKCRTFGTPKLLVNAAPYLWETDVEFIAREPWFQDLLPSGSLANVLNPIGGFEVAGGTQTLWRSLDTLSTGTLSYWTQVAGAWTISANVVTSPATSGALMTGGHSDWTDITFRTRFRWFTGAVPQFRIHITDTNNFILAQPDGVNLVLYKDVAGTVSQAASIAAALVTGTWYWMQIQAVGTTYTVTLYNDSAGAVGTQIATTNAVIADAILQSGYVGFGNGNATQFSIGGAFQGTCIVTGLGPQGWNAQVLSGEPAFAWTKNAPYSGTYCVSVYSLIGSQGQWYASSAMPLGTNFLASARMKTVGVAGTGAAVYMQNYPPYTRSGASPSVLGTTPWTLQQTTAMIMQAGDTGVQTTLQLAGSGTAYWDEVVLQQTLDTTSGLYVQPFADRLATPGSSGAGTATSFSIPYLGSVWAKPQWVFTVPVSSNVTQLKLQNATSGEVITITFGAPLTAALTITLDANTLRITDQNGVEYDWVGSFPMLYPGTNAMVATVVSSSGTPAVSLDSLWINRWVL